jgi:ribosomal protein S6--L-glutamate ligase
MRVAVLGSTQSWYLDDLRRAAGRGHEITAVTFRQLQSSVGGTGRGDGDVHVSSDGLDLGQADCVLVRTMPPGSLEQVVFRMDALGRLEAQGALVVNPPRAIEVAVDKYLATARLQAAGLPVPRTIVCQTPEEACEAWEALGGDAVLKPLFGSEGRGITRLQDEAIALRCFHLLHQLGAVIYLQQFIAHEGCDVRILLVGDRVLAMRRRNPHDWRTNVSRGAVTEPLQPTEWMIDLARRAAEATGAVIAGVDLIEDRSGELYVIEVNAVPGWKALAATVNVDVAALVLEDLQTRVHRR